MMNIPPLHPQEEKRLATLCDYQILDTPSEKAFDDLVVLASHIFQTPIALVSFIAQSRQWFKSKVGIEVSETPREHSFCGHAILQQDVLIIEDALKDSRFCDNPLVIGPPHIRFYAGAPLIAPNGLALGTLCVIDKQPRTMNAGQIQALEILANQVVSQMELRIKIDQITSQNTELQQAKLKNEQAAKNRTLFLSTLSHDFYEQLNGITELSEVLMSTSLSEEQKAINELIQSISHLLLGISQDAMDYSKLELQEIKIEKQPFPLEESLSHIDQVLRPLAIQKGLSFKILIANPVPKNVIGDFKRLNQILLCLGKEAIHFSTKGEVLLEVLTKGEMVEFLISDAGEVIAKHLWGQVFDYGSDSASTHPLFYKLIRGQSADLSMATSKKLAQVMGGELILIRSDEEKTQFALQLPLLSS